MKHTIKTKTKVPIGMKRYKQGFVFFKVLHNSEGELQARFLWWYSWEEEMQEWCENPFPERVGMGYQPVDDTPNVYGWRGTRWMD